jgi:hypothetical protein
MVVICINKKMSHGKRYKVVEKVHDMYLVEPIDNPYNTFWAHKDHFADIEAIREERISNLIA